MHRATSVLTITGGACPACRAGLPLLGGLIYAFALFLGLHAGRARRLGPTRCGASRERVPPKSVAAPAVRPPKPLPMAARAAPAKEPPARKPRAARARCPIPARTAVRCARVIDAGEPAGDEPTCRERRLPRRRAARGFQTHSSTPPRRRSMGSAVTAPPLPGSAQPTEQPAARLSACGAEDGDGRYGDENEGAGEPGGACPATGGCPLVGL